MRIISKFSDYYDSAQGMGIDKSLVYVRERKRIELPRDMVLRFNDLTKEWWFRPTGVEYKIFLLGFCGQIIIGIETRREYKKKHSPDTAVERIFFYDDIDGFFDYMSQHNTRRHWYGRDYWKKENRKLYERLKSFGFNQLFVEFNVPIFKVDVDYRIKQLLTLNPELKSLEFYKVYDSFAAFQEISMFMGGVLQRPENSMESISDACMRHKKGFDEWSFRKLPTKKKVKTPKTRKTDKCRRDSNEA